MKQYLSCWSWRLPVLPLLSSVPHGCHPSSSLLSAGTECTVHQIQNDNVAERKANHVLGNQSARALGEPLLLPKIHFSSRLDTLKPLTVHHTCLPIAAFNMEDRKKPWIIWVLMPNFDSPSVIDESLWKTYLVSLTAKPRFCFTEVVYISNQSRSGNVADSMGLPETHNICRPALGGPFSVEVWSMECVWGSV